MSPGESGATIDELLDRAVRAINAGDRATATTLAGQVLAVDRDNAEAEDLLAAPARCGELRRLTIMFADLVDSTALSTRLEPETYHTLVGRYRDEVRRVVERYEGHISSIKGDGLLAVFGHPKAHENDVRRAVAAGLDITRAVAALSAQAERKFGVAINVRVGIHRGLVYLDIDQDDVYGFAANLAARLCGVAATGHGGGLGCGCAVGAVTRSNSSTGAPGSGEGHRSRYQPAPGARRATRGAAAGVLRPWSGVRVERDWLQRSWQTARDATLTVPGVVFRGEPGMGKTRLATEAAGLVEGAGGDQSSTLRGSPLHTDTGLHPVRRLIERRCGITRLTDGGERLRLLEAELRDRALDPAAAVPLLAPVLGVGPRERLPTGRRGKPHPVRVDRGDGATAMCWRAWTTEPGLVIAEDVHWFDPSTMELLNALLADADGRLMMVLTGRDGEWLQNDWPRTVFELEPLTDEQSDALIEALDATRDRRAAGRGTQPMRRGAVLHRTRRGRT